MSAALTYTDTDPDADTADALADPADDPASTEEPVGNLGSDDTAPDGQLDDAP